MRPNAPAASSTMRGSRIGNAMREYVGVTVVIALALIVACLVIRHSVDAANAARSDAEIARGRIAAANNVLGFAARLGTSTAQTVSGQAVAAISGSIETLHADDSVVLAPFALSATDRLRLTDLQNHTHDAAQDVFAAANDVLASISPTAGSGRSPSDAVAEFAERENAYTDAVQAEASFYDDADAGYTLSSRLEYLGFGILLCLIVGFGVGVVIVPAHRRVAKSMERAIRSEEQEARIGSEVARHVAERDRREAEAQFQALFKRSLIGVALTDAKGWIVESNEALATMLGYSEHELRGSLYGEWAIDGDVGSTGTDDPRARRERIFRRKNGTTLWVDQTSTVAPGGNVDAPGTIWMVQDIEKRKNAERRLQHDATHDRLTGLSNRGFFDETVSAAATRFVAGEGPSFAVCMIDLDSFKFVNDTRGHAAGDALLSSVGMRLREWAVGTRVAARYGGDEFAVLIPDVPDADSAIEHAAELQRLLDTPADVNGATLNATASIGICMATPDVVDGDAIMRAADAATYRAKALGRARAVLYDSAMAQSDDLRRRIGIELKTAVERDELMLEFQPIVSLPERRCIGFEALVRWNHPELGRVAPSIFIPVAEEVGLMRQIGSWILRKACEHLAAWQRDACVPGVKLNVNVSTHQMADLGFIDILRDCIEATGVDPQRLGLELTETAMLDRNGLANETLARIRAMGIPVVLDDFGTGYSSLSYLQLLPMDALKIDQSFIRSPHDGLASPAIVHALISLSKSLGISVVAEGVETEQQAAHLERIGCRAAQGYLFSKSLRADAALDFLVTRARLAHDRGAEPKPNTVEGVAYKATEEQTSSRWTLCTKEPVPHRREHEQPW